MYMDNGTLTEYLRRRPNTNRVVLVRPFVFVGFQRMFTSNGQVHEITLGMAYLHNKNVVHGDLKGVSGKIIHCHADH
jgi:serine/threonine protein kinase